MRLQEIPTELLILCLPNLAQSDLFNLLLVSRRFHNITLQHLYKSVFIRTDTATRINIFLKTILQTPSLAQSVRALDVDDPLAFRTPEPGAETPNWFTSAHQQNLSTVLDPFISQRHDQLLWIEDIRQGHVNAAFAVTLLSLPNLTRLSFVMRPLSRFGNYLQRYLDKASDQHPPFDSAPVLAQLSSVVLRRSPANQDHDDLHPLTDLRAFFNFKSMRFVTACQISDSGGLNLTRWSGVTHVDLRNSCADRGLSVIFTNCRNLKSFTYSHDGSSIYGIPGMLRCALKEVEHSLEALRLDFRSFCDEFDYGVLGESLASFKALKLLHIDAYNLLEFEGNYDQDSEFEYGDTEPTVADMLPASLESLHICALEPQHMQQCFAQLVDLAGMAKVKFPALREILLTVKVFVDDDVREMVKKACSAAGVQCRFTLYCGCFERHWGGKGFSYKRPRGP